MTLQPLPVIQELNLQPQRSLDFLLLADPVLAPLIRRQDLSRYQQFQLGMDLLAVAKRADVKPSEARVIHQRPAVIQELEWRPQDSLGSSSAADPVKEILFSFYNDELFRMQVTYDHYRTEGLTDVATNPEKKGQLLRPTFYMQQSVFVSEAPVL